MELFHFDPENALPLEGGVNVSFIPIRRGERLTAMLLQLDRRGDTGKREVNADVMLIVLSGEGRVRSGGQVAEVKAGDICLLPGGLLHHIWTVDERMQAVLVALGSGSV
ncbi:MAG TPA: cupin domain-containing protein [Chloroflexi bacterium]|nr:cupin domain-containing protein [Chloroflexota bacterium]